MTKENFFKWVEDEAKRVLNIADNKIAVRKQAAIDTESYSEVLRFVCEVGDLERLRECLINHTPIPNDSTYYEYLNYFINYATEIEEF